MYSYLHVCPPGGAVTWNIAEFTDVTKNCGNNKQKIIQAKCCFELIYLGWGGAVGKETSRHSLETEWILTESFFFRLRPGIEALWNLRLVSWPITTDTSLGRCTSGYSVGYVAT